jgi:hypothetical protein
VLRRQCDIWFTRLISGYCPLLFILIYDLSNDALSISDYIVSNDRMVNEQYDEMTNEQ